MSSLTPVISCTWWYTNVLSLWLSTFFHQLNMRCIYTIIIVGRPIINSYCVLSLFVSLVSLRWIKAAQFPPVNECLSRPCCLLCCHCTIHNTSSKWSSPILSLFLSLSLYLYKKVGLNPSFYYSTTKITVAALTFNINTILSLSND